ncbi:hypothetical protein FKP32DRAFT_691368 [Trametes sanguinea]|nr:hypothetical protein FKP32DRAFT_691368 [Trametes sanguinea]
MPDRHTHAPRAARLKVAPHPTSALVLLFLAALNLEDYKTAQKHPNNLIFQAVQVEPQRSHGAPVASRGHVCKQTLLRSNRLQRPTLDGAVRQPPSLCTHRSPYIRMMQKRCIHNRRPYTAEPSYSLQVVH